MGNINTRQISSQTKDEGLSAPILGEESEVKVDTRLLSGDALLKKVDEKNPPGTQESQKKKRKTRLEEMIIDERLFLPNEFKSLEDIKQVYLAQKDKKKKEADKEIYEWDLTAFAQAEILCLTISSDEKYITSGNFEGLLTIFDLKSNQPAFSFRDVTRTSFIRYNWYLVDKAVSSKIPSDTTFARYEDFITTNWPKDPNVLRRGLIKNEVKESIESQVSQVRGEIIKSMEDQVNQLREEVKNMGEQMKEQVKEQVSKSMEEQVGQIKNDIQGLRQLIDQVLTKLA